MNRRRAVGKYRNVEFLKTLIWEWEGVGAKQHDGCEIQLLEGEDKHTRPLKKTFLT